MIVSSENDVPEIFYTLQGEGASCGRPAIFVRLSNCNLTCVWCDTPYTWNFEKVKSDHPEKYTKANQQKEISVQDLRAAINQYPDNSILVITGGEPMLQQKEIIELIYGGKLEVDHIEIETNGTIIPDMKLIARCRFNVSLKLSNAKMSPEKRLRSAAIAAYVQANSVFKFVVDSPEDLEEIQRIIERFNIDSSQVWLMPQGRAENELNSKLEWLAAICIENAYNLTNRLHVQTWGAKRGV
jgi:7-carboxy-7-deazaguanine synthase